MVPERHAPRFLLLVALPFALLAGCSEPAQAPPAFDRTASAAEAPLPETLAELGAFLSVDAALAPREGVAYALGHPLFSDYADKYRTVHLPPGTAARRIVDIDGAGHGSTLQFPVGTLITKTFHYPESPLRDGRVVLAGPAPFAGPDAALALAGRRLVETRVLLHRQGGWDAVSYLWNEAGTGARRVRAGALLTLATVDGERFDYLVPDVNQCAGCHATHHGSRTLQPIGPKPANLAAVEVPLPSGGSTDQYRLLQVRALVQDTGPVTPWPHTGPGAARAYLDVNCAHCHSDTGAADTAGLDLRFAAPRSALGVCKSPVAAGRGSGGLARDIWPGRPDASILLYRMDHRDPDVMMPELGRSLIHSEGVALIRNWITGIEGDCEQGTLL